MNRVAVVAALVALWSCETNFPPRTLVDGYRVFGVIAEPPAVSPNDTVSLRLMDTGAPGTTHQWTMCPVSTGPLNGFACLDAALERRFTTDTSTLEVDLGPDGADLLGSLVTWFSSQGQGGEGCDEGCMARAMNQVLDLQFTVRSQPPDQPAFTTVRTVRVQADDRDLNANPAIASLTVNGRQDGVTVAPGSAVELHLEVEPTSLQSFTRANGERATEEGQVSWYATAGGFDTTFSFGTSHQNRLTLPENLTGDGVRLFVGLRDGRGGFAFVQRELALGPRPSASSAP